MPGQPMQLNPAYSHTGMATASLILGIISLPASILNILTLPIPITAIVLGFISLKRKKSFALAGIILGVIGIILSAVVLAVGVHVLKKNAVTTNSATGATSVNSNCYSFSLPSTLSKQDISKNADCVTLVIKSDNTEDLVVNSTSLKSAVSDADRDKYLKSIIESGMSDLNPSKYSITNSGYIDIDGARAYRVKGTENQGNYKYLSVLAVLSPKSYMSANGSKLQAFIIASDSATDANQLDGVVNSWHWK